ncbi:MAG: type II toxin-antitoxin system Phd/YefM family antitoxin [Coriobacteriia bacterium]|nr:type II toxin-antitoxin system Phd/YefM family antitoxin [Coriobacteriia bacterium]
MNSTQVIPSRDLRNNYASVLKGLEEHNRFVITTRGRGQAVLINYDDYKDYENYLADRRIWQALREAELYAASPDAEWLEHDELWSLFGEQALEI